MTPRKTVSKKAKAKTAKRATTKRAQSDLPVLYGVRLAHPLADLAGISLSRGSHTSASKGMCVNEAVAWLAGEKHSDRPGCMCPVIASGTLRFNDNLPSNAERDRYLKDLIPTLIGTRTTAADETTRSYMAADWLIRQRTPAFLRLAGMTAEAETLEGLARIVDAETAKAARAKAAPIRDAA